MVTSLHERMYDLLQGQSRSGMRVGQDLETNLRQACHGCQCRELQRQGLKGLLLLRLSSATRQCSHVKSSSPDRAQSSIADQSCYNPPMQTQQTSLKGKCPAASPESGSQRRSSLFLHAPLLP